jgi:alkanesulfonate monooxygenase SsuD/methylene tetrahydromethanopterin reductase-like flavin-dependent oxidoreductase (luciferase family)
LEGEDDARSCRGGAGGVVVVALIGEYSAEVALVEHDDMIEAIATDGTDQPLNEWILPGRAIGDDDFLDPAGRGDRLREAVAILDAALRGGTVSHDGSYYRLTEATFRPGPTQSPRPPLWVAAQASRSLRVAARHADAVVSLGEYEKGIEESLPAFRVRMERLDEICVEEGRDPTTLRRCYFAGWANEPIFASPEATTDLIGRYTEAGATDFTFYLHNPAEPLPDGLLASHRMATRGQLEQAAQDVFPRFRD